MALVSLSELAMFDLFAAAAIAAAAATAAEGGGDAGADVAPVLPDTEAGTLCKVNLHFICKHIEMVIMQGAMRHS